MGFKPEEVQRFLEDHKLADSKDKSEKSKKRIKIKSERRLELINKLLATEWGRELWYDIIVDAEILKLDPFTGNSQTYHIEGRQKMARVNMNYVKKFNFKEWLLMEQEAHEREKEIENGTN